MRTDLPETCLSTVPGTGELIVLKRGETGYYRSEWNTDDAERNKQIADDHNRARGLTPAQVEAMRVGSMFGFAVPGANPQMYLDAAKQEEKFHVEGHIKDTVISLYHPITCDLLNYKVAGKVVTYLEPIALPDSMMGAQSGITLFAEMVGGEPLIPVLATQSPEQKYTFGLADGCFSNFREVNQGYLILAKVRVGAKEFVLAESPTAPSRFATWARTLTNDGDGEPNYYHGNYCSDRTAAILDFCNRARNQYEYEISVRRVAPHKENDRER